MRVGGMSWNSKVLDNLEQIYWSLDKVGLRPVKGQLSPDGESYVLPSKLLAGGRSLYCRAQNSAEWKSALLKKEELLNQVLEIGFAIAPSAFLAEAFFAPLGLSVPDRITTIGREAKARHAELAPRQFTQHDGFYITENAVVMMEMKLKARTSVEQYLKYCTLIALEELLYGKKEHLGLVYLVPDGSVARTRKDLRLDDPDALCRIWEKPQAHTDKSTLLALLDRHEQAIRDVGVRLRIGIITWGDFRDVTLRFHDDARRSGNETLENLMHGILAQLDSTPDCGMASDDR